MGRGYGALVTVWEREERPVRFQWQGRIHVVHRILDHWVTQAAAVSDGGEGALRLHVWRVSAGPDHATGVYELRHDPANREWRLIRPGG
ncbi:DUF6504 family protein [Marinactinospora thermotolerans]|uniref:DUF6504 domain-containing protein n=1 Tax=Marinactinospora thermotolerans DSM 45154 TaxID=1122192 RepID=A0A1T4T8C7_9ACTN|nr:DUF6504 family protein [Marinactinospora thermotolerans]SKA36663.1 hypothetical protein SAMN02745673_04621 [Marinactinospora thermotolerans DSM 45154]